MDNKRIVCHACGGLKCQFSKFHNYKCNEFIYSICEKYNLKNNSCTNHGKGFRKCWDICYKCKGVGYFEIEWIDTLFRTEPIISGHLDLRFKSLNELIFNKDITWKDNKLYIIDLSRFFKNINRYIPTSKKKKRKKYYGR